MSVGAKIERFRKNKGWSRQNLSDRCPDWIDKVVIRQIESGAQVKNYLEAIVAIAQALRVSITQLVGGQPTNPELVVLIKEIHKLSSELLTKSEDL